MENGFMGNGPGLTTTAPQIPILVLPTLLIDFLDQ